MQRIAVISSIALLSACGSSGGDAQPKPNNISSLSASSSSVSIANTEEFVSIFAINAGGDKYQADNGVLYRTDVYSTAGADGATEDEIANTDLQDVYQSERWGTDFSYEIPVTNGVFDVTLHMLEQYWNATGARVQNVYIEGQQVIDAIDLFDSYGHDVAFNAVFPGIVVNDGVLNIRFEGVEDAANVAGVLIEAQSGLVKVPEPPATSQIVKVNQLGYLPHAAKIAIIPNTTELTFDVVNTVDNTVVLSGNLSEALFWEPSEETVKQADFSALQMEGTFKIVIAGKADSPAFSIGSAIYSDAHDAALKAYYFNRASIELLPEFAGVWARAPGHPDDQVEVIAAAATVDRPVGTVISAAKGWYDAGDYNKYVVNAGAATYTLLAAYEHFQGFYADRTLNIPESVNAAPDILDEIVWNLEWLENMQDLDGGVYHKLSTANFSGIVMPAAGTAQRYVDMKTTAATLDFAAVMAVASRVYADFDAQFPGKSEVYKQAAIDAWAWASTNAAVPFKATDIYTGAYSTWSASVPDDAVWAAQEFKDEFAWAAAELYLLTEEAQYLTAFNANVTLGVGTPWWAGVEPFAYISLAEHGKDLLSDAAYEEVTAAIVELADSLVVKQEASAYKVPMTIGDFGWGSNSGALNQGMMAYQAYRITNDGQYLAVAESVLDYIFGRNATEYSFVTGFGSKSPMAPHHRPSAADGIDATVPGFVVGGPQPGQQDIASCGSYPFTLPATAYIDDWCSYATNEVTINWNAPLVYLLAAVQAD